MQGDEKRTRAPNRKKEIFYFEMIDDRGGRGMILGEKYPACGIQVAGRWNQTQNVSSITQDNGIVTVARNVERRLTQKGIVSVNSPEGRATLLPPHNVDEMLQNQAQTLMSGVQILIGAGSLTFIHSQQTSTWCSFSTKSGLFDSSSHQ
jgi:hypothetical protein